MGNRIIIVMYHYVRDLSHSRYPGIKGLDLELFRQQLDFFKSGGYRFISPDLLLEAANGGNVPEKSVLLTFDDGYLDHYTNVFPILVKENITAVFSMPGKILAEHKVLNVNKIHFLLASVETKELLPAICKMLDYYRGSEFSYPSTAELYAKLAHPNRFDSAEVIFIKRLLQVELPELLRDLIVDDLFRKYVSANEESFALELYMSLDQVSLMKREGMTFAYHGYDHSWIDRLDDDSLTADIERALDTFSGIIDRRRWICCYPYGSCSGSVIETVKAKGALCGIGTDAAVADLTAIDPFRIPRLDTNDFPPKSNNYLKF